MVWGYSGNIYQGFSGGVTYDTAENFGFEYLRTGTSPRYQGRATAAKYRIGVAGNKCQTNSNGIKDVTSVEYIRIASIPTQMIPAAIRVFTSFDIEPSNTAFFLGLAYPATEEEEANDTGRILGHTSSGDINDVYEKYFGRINSDLLSIVDTLKTTQNKDQDRMLTVWPNLKDTSQPDYADWTLNRYSKSIKEVWDSPEVQSELEEAAKTYSAIPEETTLPQYLDIVLRNVPSGTEPNLKWEYYDFMQFNCTFVDGG